MKCSICNAEIFGEFNFCPECGSHIQTLKNVKSTFNGKPNITETNIESEETNISDINIESTKAKKWGWGWYLLVGLVYISLGKMYPSQLNTHKNIIIIFGTIISVPIYVYFRNKVFDEMSATKTRSFISGLIAYFITALLVTVLAAIMLP